MSDDVTITREDAEMLADFLRRLVAECEGLPDDLWVRIDNGNINESGRRDTTFEVSWRVEALPSIRIPDARYLLLRDTVLRLLGGETS